MQWFRNKWIQLVLIILTGIAGAILTVTMFGPSSYKVNGFTVEFALQPAYRGQTLIDLPPVGTLTAQTHAAPFQLSMRLERIDAGVVKDDQVLKQIQDTMGMHMLQGLKNYLLPFLIKQLLLAGLGAMVLVWALLRPRIRYIASSGLISMLLVLAVLWWGMNTFEAKAFTEPEYDGVIALAPDMMRVGEQMLNNLDQLQNNTSQVLSNIRILFGKMDSLPVLGDPDGTSEVKRILIVSDMHSNPVGLELTRSIVNNFNIQLLINAGDLTDYGSPLEVNLAEQLKQFNIPQVFEPGNHDTPEVTDFMRTLPNTHVLDGNVVEVEGFRLLGAPDPLSSSTRVINSDRNDSKAELEKQYNDVLNSLDTQGKPDIIVIHNPRYAEKLAGLAPVVISGHLHRTSIRESHQTALLNPGSTGASGLRGVYSEAGVPYSAMILYMQPGQNPIAVDLISYHPSDGKFSIERSLLNEPDQQTQP